MGKVKQAIQEVQQEVMEIVMSRTSLERGDETITLPDLQTIHLKGMAKDNNGYFLDEDVVKNAYYKEYMKKENEEEYKAVYERKKMRRNTMMIKK